MMLAIDTWHGGPSHGADNPYMPLKTVLLLTDMGMEDGVMVLVTTTYHETGCHCSGSLYMSSMRVSGCLQLLHGMGEWYHGAGHLQMSWRSVLEY